MDAQRKISRYNVCKTYVKRTFLTFYVHDLSVAPGFIGLFFINHGSARITEILGVMNPQRHNILQVGQS
jgi:hypothetical protein